MIHVLYRSAEGADPPLLDTFVSSPPVEGEKMDLQIDSMNLASYDPAQQEALRLAAPSSWEVVQTKRTMPGIGHAGPTSAADRHEAVIRPIFQPPSSKPTREPARTIITSAE